MSFRIIRNLAWAIPCKRPNCIGHGRPRGVKRLGVVYERLLAEELGGDWKHGQWFEFEDQNGHGYCQPDFVRVVDDAAVVLEAKLTWLPEAHQQIDLLYRPVLEAVFDRQVVGVVVAKRLVAGMNAAIAHNLPSALEAARAVPRVALHWTGKTSLYPSPRVGLSALLPLSTTPAHSNLQ